MIRLLCAVTVIVLVVTGVPHSRAQTPSVASSTQAMLDEAERLNERVKKLHKEGKYGEAIVLAEQALALREKALGPSRRDVAQSLNNLAVLYQEQGAYAKAEPLLVRALAITEKTFGPSHHLVATGLNNLA